MPTWINSGRIPGLDGLRAVAVLIVVLAHTAKATGSPVPPVVWKIGPVGVNVFFVLSGFLITTLLCRKQSREGHISIGEFYLRRALRILPALIAYLAFIAALTSSRLAEVGMNDWLAATTFTVNLFPHPACEVGHLWSLGIEEHFYLVWPLVFALLPRRMSVWVAATPLVVCPLLRWVVLIARADLATYTEEWTVTRLDHIAAGSLMALVAQSPAGVPLLDRLSRWWPAALAATVAALIGSQLSGKIAVGLAPTATAISVAILVWASARFAPRCLEWKPVVWLGTLSYSLYLWQQPFLHPDGPYWFQSFPINLLPAFGCAVACHYLVERPFIRLRPQIRKVAESVTAPG